ncbi:DeoR/GlpR family DNA-binding transcription regulator [Propionivibrio dicarboxylicus]|uniref:Transcriptional regulator, DeoR family n=1 Tax=Propionivibrio dicarboxylicus TaxID=83767 RepID=A0A1G8LHJ7_9RHOO|nr:DeoR family transcriptional regulator [Propionivibrio dicarboxylicus]SDI55179.1 transcriptional regulator, DeoR family [Propionivibrio dicarboxylicus]
MTRQSTESKLGTRHRQILDLAKQQGFLSTEALARHFDVTTQTIRRDINYLCDEGLLRRFHGGAGPVSSVENVDYSARQILNHEAKIRIARAVVEEIPDNASLFINIGTTTEEVAKALAGHRNLRIITNNLNVASQLCSNENFEVIVAGGVVRNDRGVIGESTIDFIRQFKVDFGIIGISGIDADGTLLDFDYREVRVAQAIIENSRQIFLVTDRTKFSITPMVKLGTLADVDVLFTDAPPPADIQAVLAETQTRLVIAKDMPRVD